MDFFPPSSATRIMYRGEPSPLDMGQMASNSPAGCIRRMGRGDRACLGSTTQACIELGKYARTAKARRPASFTS